MFISFFFSYSLQFARYLAQEMGNSDQFGSSSDEDDEDEGWLTQSTFGLNPAPVATRPFSEPRRPLSSNGFGVRVVFCILPICH